MAHRASYWKTTAIALAAAAICLTVLGGILASGFPPTLIALASFVLGVGGAFLLLVAAGGLVCLWRDGRENSGKQDLLARLAVKDPARFPLRALFGRRLRPGDFVEVRSLKEIAPTLDEKGTLAGLPFMREMEPFCGQVFRVHRRVDHINDMRNKTGLRRLRDAVTLTDVRCSGADHGNCQAECQILWKDTWLKRVHASRALPAVGHPPIAVLTKAGHENPTADEQAYFCQMTALWEASHAMSPRGLAQHFRPLLSGNVAIADFLVAALTRLFDAVQALRGGSGYPSMPQSAGKGRTPSMDMDLQAGDAVIVRSKDEVAATLVAGRNRGLWFDRDMIRYCGQPAVVRKRVSRLIHEGTGKMAVMKTPCLMLEDVIATGEFLRLCPQHEYIFWREIWLQRAGQAKAGDNPSGAWNARSTASPSG